MQLPRDRGIAFKRYGLYTCGVVCGYLMIFIVGPFFFSMGVILVITGALFSLEQISSGGWIFMIVGIIIFILGVTIPKVCGAILSRMIVRDVTDIVKENEPALNELAEAVNNLNEVQNENNLRARQPEFPGFYTYHSYGFNMGGDTLPQWLPRQGSNPTMQSAAGFPPPPPYPGRRQPESTTPPPHVDEDTHVNIPHHYGKDN